MMMKAGCITKKCSIMHTPTYRSLANLSSDYRVFVSMLYQVQTPSTIEVFEDPNCKAAAFEETWDLEKNNTWVPTELPHGKQ